MLEKVFVSSVFKSGTWLLRDVVAAITGLQPDEPDRIVGEPDYSNPELIRFRPGHFFSWHSRINEPVAAYLKGNGIRPVFLARNVYDLAVSMYHHLADDIDAEHGFSTKQSGFFGRFSHDQGLSMIIAGYTCEHGTFAGVGEHYVQIEQMLDYAARNGALMLTYEDLVTRRRAVIRSLAQYLQISLPDTRVHQIAQATEFENMKQQAVNAGGGSHFRKGRVGQARSELGEHHAAMIWQQVLSRAPRLPELATAAGMTELIGF